MAGNNDHLLGFAEVCAALSDRFGTSFELQNTGGNCVTLMAHLEGGIKVLITDCVGTLSPAYGWRITSMSPPLGTLLRRLSPLPSRWSGPDKRYSRHLRHRRGVTAGSHDAHIRDRGHPRLPAAAGLLAGL